MSRWLAATALGLLLALCAAVPGTAFAHAGDATGFASATVSGDKLTYVYTPTPASKADTAALPALLRTHLQVTAAGQPCAADDGQGLTVTFQCPQPIRQAVLSDHLFDAVGDSHHVIAVVTWTGGSLSHVFAKDAPEATINVVAATNSAAAHATATGFFLLGVEHIATGYDHLLFLLALILCGGSLVQLLKIITAFTLAHSLTLGAAALDIVTLPSAMVEAVIALSIAYVAFENLYPRYAVSRRWAVSFLFGLVHGFGFSSVLKEIGLPKDSLLLSLLNFNLGVEAGQLAAVVIVVPLLTWLRTTSFETRVVRGMSLVVLAVGLGLFIERVAFGA
ncbi:MAG: hypothetical protein RL404_1680 [Pseudomonadota bacterium]